MAIVKYANQSGVVYAYESVSEWDPEKKQSRSKRKCIGRVDPDTGEIVPTSGKRGRPAVKKAGDPGNTATVDRLKAGFEEEKKKNLVLAQENKKLKDILSKIKKDISGI